MALTLSLVRGLPGSGKTTLAKALWADSLKKGANPNVSTFKCDTDVVEADMFFLTGDGRYKFNRELIRDAHEWCRMMTGCSLSSERNVIVANTFTETWEILPYIEMAAKLDAEVAIYEAVGDFKSIHNVPDFAAKKMKDRWVSTPDMVKEIDKKMRGYMEIEEKSYVA